MSAQYTLRTVGDVTIVDCAGRITFVDQGAESLGKLIEQLAADGKKSVVLNLAETSYVDHCGIANMISGFQRLACCGATLKLLALQKRVKDLLQITNLYTVFEVFEDEATAVASFRETPARQPFYSPDNH